jgi:hypothetical protein
MAPDVVRARIDELVELWRRDPLQSVTASTRDSPAVPLTVFGLTAHAYSLAAAIRVLDEADCGPTIVPLVRQLIECAVTAAWVETYGRRAALKLIHEDARQRWLMFNKFVQAGVKDDGAVEEWLAARTELDPDAQTPGARFWERCDELQSFTSSYAFYRALSLASHADGMVADLYHREVSKSPGSPLGVAITARPQAWAPDGMLGLALTYLLLASMAWDRLNEDHPSRTRLEQIAAEIGFGLDWSQSAAGRERQHAWEETQRERPGDVG